MKHNSARLLNLKVPPVPRHAQRPISVGRSADFVVLDRDPFADPGTDMGSLRATYRAGVAVYQAS